MMKTAKSQELRAESRNKAKSLGLRAKGRTKPVRRFIISGPQPSALSPRPGFTLVEMLVAVALVLLLMTLFAQVFQIAGGSISTQRGIMENDQRARTAQILLTGDLNKRTFRFVVPYAFNENTSAPEAALQRRQGYFSISENRTANDTDDVLCFTVDARNTADSPDTLDYFGRALPLWPDPIPVSPPLPPLPPAVPGSVPVQFRDDFFFRQNLNQPETDDSRLDYNQSATSPAAEVCYFLRNGNLYRRVLLLRQATSVATATHEAQQPQDQRGNRFLARWYNLSQFGTTYRYPGTFATSFDDMGNSQGQPANFWRHFDYSAHPGITDDGAMPPQYLYDGVEFNGTASLQMPYTIQTFPYTAFALPFVPSGEFRPPTEIAYPANRFGHSPINPLPLSVSPGPFRYPFGGQPREYGSTGGVRWWVGRPTMEETSRGVFQYPMLVHALPNSTADPLNPFNEATAWADALPLPDGDSVIDAYEQGPWRGEDLLLTNVHAFDVKVWDETLGQFADVGHTLSNAAGLWGDFHIFYRNNNRYGPTGMPDPTDSVANPRDPTGLVGTGRRVFDTWYPFSTEDLNGNGTIDAPLETDSATAGELDGQLLDFDADGNLTLNDFTGDGVVDYGENLPPYRPMRAWAVPGISGSPGPGPNPLPASPPGPTRFPRWMPNTGTGNTWYPIGARVFPSVAARQFGDPFYYICIKHDINEDGDYPHGMTEPAWPRFAGGTVDDGDIRWQAVDNRKPLRAIQITLRFLDPSTGQLRTMTLQHSLVD
jgi:prepilin-type N-terminal cleavage/methylation domain-containing protein